jgi:hypothetical protein
LRRVGGRCGVPNSRCRGSRRACAFRRRSRCGRGPCSSRRGCPTGVGSVSVPQSMQVVVRSGAGPGVIGWTPRLFLLGAVADVGVLHNSLDVCWHFSAATGGTLSLFVSENAHTRNQLEGGDTAGTGAGQRGSRRREGPTVVIVVVVVVNSRCATAALPVPASMRPPPRRRAVRDSPDISGFVENSCAE